VLECSVGSRVRELRSPLRALDSTCALQAEADRPAESKPRAGRNIRCPIRPNDTLSYDGRAATNSSVAG
jgi:hypothetical protein